MKKYLWPLSVTLIVALLSAGFISCGSDDDDPASKIELKVSPTEISLMAQANSAASFTVTANESWTITNSADWLNLSSYSGRDGSTPITVTAISANASSEKRTATIFVQCGEKSEVVTITQLAGFKDVQVNFNTETMVTLTTSVAFEQTYSGDISYYYAGYLKKSSSAGWTDDKIAQTLSSEFDAQQPEDDDVMSIEGLTSNTSYYLCAVAYDAQGNRGPVTKVEITTPKAVNNRPRVNISNVTYSSTTWEWDTTIGPYASRYYMWAVGDDDAIYFILSADALVAYYIQKSVASGDLSPIVQNGSWSMSRTSSDNYFYCAAWAQDSDGKFANELDVFYGSISSDAKVRRTQAQALQKPKVSVHKQSDYKKFHVSVSSKK